VEESRNVNVVGHGHMYGASLAEFKASVMMMMK